MSAPERIWMPPLWEVGDGTIPTDGQCEDDDIFYIRSDLHDAAIAKARAEGMREAVARLDTLHVQHMTAKGRNPAEYSSSFDVAAKVLRQAIADGQP